ncbi:hypothetical protein [Azospirillum largimobile]
MVGNGMPEAARRSVPVAAPEDIVTPAAPPPATAGGCAARLRKRSCVTVSCPKAALCRQDAVEGCSVHPARRTGPCPACPHSLPVPPAFPFDIPGKIFLKSAHDDFPTGSGFFPVPPDDARNHAALFAAHCPKGGWQANRLMN